jgi:N-methylhydantoinase A|tara:strand:+ start:14800 stop:16845 length:2046 start_codon:yes stop_codon:yes gene_type:complete
MGYRVGVDVGGSFTDFAILDEADHSVRALKVLSRPDKPGAEITTGIQLIESQHGIDPRDISYFTHGTTVGINTVIQRSGIRLALFTTRNFEDVLELGRLKTPDVLSLTSKRPAPLISRDLVFPVTERIDQAGKELEAVNRESVIESFARAKEAGCDGVVISLLHSYRNPDHEQEVKEILADLDPEMPVFCSSEIWPIIREYERTITASISGYVQPKVEFYLESFERALQDLMVSAKPHITKSNGGVMGVEQAKSECVQMILSGTASGVIGASFIADTCDYPKVLSCDVGGTSADVAVIVDGQPQYATGELIGDFNIYIPSVSVSSVGHGGGSIAWVDSLGVLKVGPRSAGSNPGPACYGKGGDEPTLTDAFVSSGLVGHAELGYNAINIDPDLADAAIATLARPLGLSVHQTAEQVIKVAVSGMFTAVSGLVARFAIDPREFYFMAFGGAGPMVSCFLARELKMKGVIVPPTPGVLSALGGLIANLKNDFIQTVYKELAPGIEDAMTHSYSELAERAIKWLREDQEFDGDYTLTYSAEMRYAGQSFEIETPLERAWIEAGDIEAIGEAFHQRHDELFDHTNRHSPIQVISLRLVIDGATPKPMLVAQMELQQTPEPEAEVQAFVDGQLRAVPLYQRSKLGFGAKFSGPAIVGQDDCTTCIPEGFDTTVDAYGNLVITLVSN